MVPLALTAFAASIVSGKTYVGIYGAGAEVSWNTAKDRCSCLGGRLATFGTDPEYEKIKKMAEGAITTAGPTWVGLYDPAGNGQWQFVDGDNWSVTVPARPLSVQHMLCRLYT